MSSRDHQHARRKYISGRVLARVTMSGERERVCVSERECVREVRSGRDEAGRDRE